MFSTEENVVEITGQTDARLSNAVATTPGFWIFPLSKSIAMPMFEVILSAFSSGTWFDAIRSASVHRTGGWSLIAIGGRNPLRARSILASSDSYRPICGFAIPVAARSKIRIGAKLLAFRGMYLRFERIGSFCIPQGGDDDCQISISLALGQMLTFWFGTGSYFAGELRYG